MSQVLSLSVFLVVLNVLSNIAARQLPLCQCMAIAFRILILSVRFKCLETPGLQYGFNKLLMVLGTL